MRFLWLLLWSSLCLSCSVSEKPGEKPIHDSLSLRVQLGKQLFFDPILSRDRTISCGHCHQPELAFTDGLPTGKGMKGRILPRNTPSLLNVRQHPYLFADGGVPSLEMQALAPIEDHNEMDILIPQVLYRLRRHPDYPEFFEEAFGREPDGYSLVRALSAYQQSLVSEGSPFDLFLQSGDSSYLSATQWQGWQLFSGQAKCSSCHAGKWLSDFQFYNLGLGDSDPGRERITLLPADSGKFKTPVLRNLTITGPYMHNGSISTLGEVVEHHDRRLGTGLSRDQKEKIVHFLKALTDSVFTSAYNK